MNSSLLLECLEKEYEELNAIYQEALHNVKKAPKGGLRIIQNKGTKQYYHTSEHNDKLGKYISKKNFELIKSLSRKRYDQEVAACTKIELMAIQDFIDGYLARNTHENLKTIYDKQSQYKKMLFAPLIMSDAKYLENWLCEEYEGKPFEDNDKELYTDSGIRVRSKSEQLAGNKLEQLNIPYKYEHPLYLEGFGCIYPDFTLLDLKRRREVIYEHFGIMDNPEYASKAIKKLRLYEKNGYVLGDNLIITFETEKIAFDSRLFESNLKRIGF